jgi:hypothetical protein
MGHGVGKMAAATASRAATTETVTGNGVTNAIVRIARAAITRTTRSRSHDGRSPTCCPQGRS